VTKISSNNKRGIMEIVIIGSGNVAAVLGRKFKAAGHHIVQIYSRNAKAASELAYEWDTESTNYKSTISKTADVYIVAVSDIAIPEVMKDIKLPGKVVAHTAASVPEENITVENDRWAPIIKFGKKKIRLPKKKDDTRYSAEEAAAFTLEDVKKFIEAEIPGAFVKKQKAAKKKATKKAPAKKTAIKKKAAKKK